MADSPLSTPGTPTTASPLPSDADFARSFSPSQDDAQLMGSQPSPEDVWTSTPAPGAVGAPPLTDLAPAQKGKAKASKGPLKLLDLPVDILKEIIHQVSRHPPPGAVSVMVSPWRAGMLTIHSTASAYQRLDVAMSLPLGPSPADHTMHLFALRHCMARRKYPQRAPCWR